MIPMTPSVAMKGGRRTSTTSAELRAPASTPTASPAIDARQERPLVQDVEVSGHHPDSAITAPGARSTPPEMMTMAAPMAAMP